MTMMEIQVLGSLRFKDPKGIERKPSTRKAAMLAAYLALHPETRFTREKIAGLLWSEKDEQRARHSLSQALSDLKLTFGENELIRSDPQHIWACGSHVAVDFARLAAINPVTATREELELFESLHSGPFLEGLDSRANGLTSWLYSERERLNQRLHDALFRLADMRLRGHEHLAALETARQVLVIDPYDEAAHRIVMLCHLGRGAKHAAIASYRALEEQLMYDLGVTPERETVALFNSIKSGAEVPPMASPLNNIVCALEQLPYATTVTDMNARIVGWNSVAEKTFGFCKKEMCGLPPTAVYSQGVGYPHARDIIQSALSTGHWEDDVVITTKTGDTISQHRIVSPLFDMSGTLIGAFGHGYPV